MHIFCHKNMQEAKQYDFLNGEAVVYSTPSPDKQDEDNQDACALIPLGENSGLLVLADGVGGQDGGQDASSLIIQNITDITKKDNFDSNNLREPILNAIEKCNAALLAEDLGGATTLVIVEIQEKQIRPYYIGDSSILITGQRGRIKYQNILQSPVGYALESGLLKEQDTHNVRDRFRVSNVLGTDSMYVTVGAWVPMTRRDTLIMCSDGLTDNVYTHIIIDVIRLGSLETIAEKLRDLCNRAMPEEHGHLDDLSFILFRLGQSRSKLEPRF